MNARELFLSWGMLILSIILNAVGIFVFKIKLNELGPMKLDSFKATINYFMLLLTPGIIIAGFFLFIVAPFMSAVALSRMEITVVYPAQIVLNFVILALLAVIFLGESMTLIKGIAIILAIFSTLLLCKK